MKDELSDVRIRLGVSRSHSVRDKSIVSNVYIFRISFESGSVPLLPKVRFESRSRKSGNMQSIYTIFFSHLRSVIIMYLSFLPLITGKIASFTVKWSFSSSHSLSKDVVYARNTESECKMLHVLKTRDMSAVEKL